MTSIQQLLKGLYKTCGCGCGNLRLIVNKNSVIRNYIKGHNAKGSNNHFWIGGRVYDGQGYYMLWLPNYFNCTKDSYVREHIYFYQEKYKLCMLKHGVVHHIDGNKEMNMPWNLQGMMKKDHTKLHSKKYMTDRLCSDCGTDKTHVDKLGYSSWCNDGNGGWLCNKCKNKEYWKKHSKEILLKKKNKKLL